MAIAGFHGHDVGQSMTPQLATVITPRFEIVKIAAQRIDSSPKSYTTTA